MEKNLILFTTAFLGLAISFTSCQKKNEGCDGGNLCFTLNGVDVSVEATRLELPNNRNRIYWEEGSNNNYKNIELDIFGNTVAEYDISDNAGVLGDAGFQYFINDNGTQTNYQGTGGKINLTSIDGGKFTGTFSGTVTDGTNSFDLTDGKFIEVEL